MSVRILTKEESIELQKEIDRWWDKLDGHWKMVIHNCFENNIFHKIEMDKGWEVRKEEQLKCKHEFCTVKFVGDKEETTYCHKCGKVLEEKNGGN
ncbi:hypothetical protein ES705_33862 [subsurface metagenome]